MSESSQLSLNITPRHAYAPENFVLHEGVTDLFAEVLRAEARDSFRLGFALGGARSGKTHFSIRLADELAKRGSFPRLIEGGDFAEYLHTARFDFTADDFLIIDDAQQYLSKLNPGQSGPFVTCIERLRVACAGILFLSSRDVDSFDFDEHVRSRLIPGLGLVFGAPAEIDMPEIIRAVAKQHGMKLSDKKLSFIVRRVGKNLGAVEDYFQRLEHLSQVLGRPIKFPLMSGVI